MTSGTVAETSGLVGSPTWTSDATEIWGAIILVVVCGLVAVPVALAQVHGDDVLRGPAWLWWTAYVAFIVSFIATFWPHGWRWITPARATVTTVVLCWLLVGPGCSR